MAYLTDEERKAPLTRVINGYVFNTCVDLSSGIKIYPQSTDSDEKLRIQAKILFTAWWCTTIHKQLNGFPGFDTVKWIDLNQNPNLMECKPDCINRRILRYGLSLNFLAKCSHDGTLKDYQNSKCFCPTQYKSKCDEK